MKKTLIFSLLCGTALTLGANPAMAQQAESTGADDAGLAPGEIVVTAQRRAERLQDVPLAVTAVNAAALEAKGITDTKNLAQVSPSLTYTQGNNPSNSTFRIRGIGTQVFGQGGEASVSVVMDGVVLARQAQGFADLADIERIEVLRGPQGTLFGKNATGGVISIVTARPTKELSGKVTASVAEMGEYHLNGTVSAPVSDTIGVRVSGFYNKDDGYIQNVTLGRKTNGYASWGLRGKLEFDLGPLNLLATGEYSKNDADCCLSVPIRTDNPQLAALQFPVVAGPNNTQVATNGGSTSITSQETYSLEGNYDLGGATITSITAYQKYAFDNQVDVDGLNTAVPIYSGGTAAPFYAQFDVNGGPITLNQFSQELRVASNGKNRLNYVFGLYYSNLNLDRAFVRRIVTCNTNALTLGAACPTANQVASSGSHFAHLDNENYAAFGQVDYQLFGGLKAIAGIRVQHESVKVYGRQDAAAPFAGDVPMFSGATLTSGTTSGSDDAVTGKAGLQYEISRNAQFYGTYTRGYKGQSLGTEFNQTFNNNPVVAPETVNAYEIGFKGSNADRTLSVSVAAYLADYSNLQVQANRSDQSTGNFLFVTTNAGKARTKGVEVEATVRPDDHFSMTFGFAYTHARFDADGIGCPLQLQAAAVTVAFGGTTPVNTCYRQRAQNGTLSGRIQDVRGGILPNTPEWRLNLSPRYETEISDSQVAYATASLAYQSEVGFALEQDPLLVQRGYTTIDATIGIRPIDSGFSASVFVRNLTGERFYTSMGHASSLTSQTLTPNNLTGFLPKGAFRYFGASVGYKF
ncbi:TonB-dependent receptor [Novosphingobium sp. SL115]|uniref:TonB-dependent receptor n=1 Tax=Novosphingobium sp. SL115 TaxID=2995150 RepID=UPI0022759B19|nr:TonB-dependent receptor [Novosphingobium sp. SL115]MCY1672937.1 TonB-dependent receptor [Novosphingobium sp. SL115]